MAASAAMGREDSDETYVLDLCDEVLGDSGLRQHRFDWLLGDPGSTGHRVKLPVDSYWPEQGLVVEYRERQHDEPTPFFDKPNRMTVSGVHRGEQRALYDSRRDVLIPANGLRLVVMHPADLTADNKGRLRRDSEADLAAIRRILHHAMAQQIESAAPNTGSPLGVPTAETAAALQTDTGGRVGSDEARVVAAFRHWLISHGWMPVRPTDPHTDIEAIRGSERLICEAKGRTKEPGTDLDIAYGQLLRRMTLSAPETQYAIVVPTSTVWHAQRVPAAIRDLLGVEVYAVSEDNEVRLIRE